MLFAARQSYYAALSSAHRHTENLTLFGQNYTYSTAYLRRLVPGNSKESPPTYDRRSREAAGMLQTQQIRGEGIGTFRARLPFQKPPKNRNASKTKVCIRRAPFQNLTQFDQQADLPLSTQQTEERGAPLLWERAYLLRTCVSSAAFCPAPGLVFSLIGANWGEVPASALSLTLFS